MNLKTSVMIQAGFQEVTPLKEDTELRVIQGKFASIRTELPGFFKSRQVSCQNV